MKFDARWIGPHGIGRFAAELEKRLPHLSAVSLPLAPQHPLDCFLLSIWMLRNPRQWIFSPGYNAPIIGLGRYVFVVHDLNHIDLPYNSSLLKRLYYALVLKRACRQAAAVLTVSDFAAARIAQWSGVPRRRVWVVGNGVSAAFHEDGPRHEERRPYFLVVGNRKAHKNESRIFEAFAQQWQKTDTHLLVVGHPTAQLDDLASRLGCSERIKFLGRLSDAELARCYRGATALVFPSLYEGFGLPVVEAMACGTPVITANTTSLPEVAGEAAILVDPNSAEEIAAAMIRVGTDVQLREQLRIAGVKRAGEFTWRKVADRVAEVLKAVRQPHDNARGNG